jgi:hypothetical protein
MAEAMGVSLKTEQRRSHTAVFSFGPWVRRAESCRGICQVNFCMEVPVKPRRPPSLPLVRAVFPDHSSFSVLRETPMAFFYDYFKRLNFYNFVLPEWISNLLNPIKLKFNRRKGDQR